MATITTTDHRQYRATFNRRNLLIDASRQVRATDTATGEKLTGAELRSVTRLVEWHVKSRRECSELVTVATVR